MNEIQRKLASVRGLLAAHQLDGILLQRVSSFAWLTGGAASYVNTATTTGAGRAVDHARCPGRDH